MPCLKSTDPDVMALRPTWRPSSTSSYPPLRHRALPGSVMSSANVASSPSPSRRILKAGLEHGLGPRLHADELVASGGARLAAELGAPSADHLTAPSKGGITALAAAIGRGRPVVATLLPATSLILMKEHDAPARLLIDRGVPVALGTDFNPGTSPTANIQIILSLAVFRLRMTPSEALAAVTINAAHALGLGETHGALEPGRVADLVIWDVPSHELLPHWLGRQPGASRRQARQPRPRARGRPARMTARG